MQNYTLRELLKGEEIKELSDKRLFPLDTTISHLTVQNLQEISPYLQIGEYGNVKGGICHEAEALNILFNRAKRITTNQ